MALLAGQKGVYRVLPSGALYVPAVLFAVVANIYIPHPLSSVPTRLAHFQLSALCFNHRLDTQVGTVFQTMFESRNSKLEWNARGSGMPTLDHLTTVSVSFRFRSGIYLAGRSN